MTTSRPLVIRLLLFCALLPSAATRADDFALVPRAGLQPARVFTDRDGLPQNAVDGLDFDAQGYLWAGTQAGAARYDGREWTLVNMPDRTRSNYIRGLRATADGAVWFGTQAAGVARLLGDAWTTFDAKTGLPNDRVLCVEADPANGPSAVWIGTPTGAARFDGSRFEAAAPDAPVAGVSVNEISAAGAEVWFATDRGVARLADGRWERFGAAEGLQSDHAISVSAEPDGAGGWEVWAGTDVGLARFDGARWEPVPSRAPGPLSVRAIASTRDAAGRRVLWVGTGAQGLLRLRDGALEPVRNPDLGAQVQILCLRVRRDADGRSDGAVWAGTGAAGLIRVDPVIWTSFDDGQGRVRSPIRSFCETADAAGNRSMWIGDGVGVFGFENGALARVPGLDAGALAMAAVRPAGAAADELWVGTDTEGLVRRANGRWLPVTPPASIGEITSVRCVLSCGDDAGPLAGVWLGTGEHGLVRVRDGAWSKLDRASGLPSDDVRWIYRTADDAGRGTLWVATNGGGLARFDGERFEVFSTANGLPNDLVRGLHEQRLADGRRLLWVGTYGGVAIRDLASDAAAWTVLSDATTPALPDNTVYQVQEDRSGRIYLFTNKGVARVTVSAPAAGGALAFAVETFTTAHGLPSSECNGGAAYADSLGRVWAGTVAGAAVLDPSEEAVDTTPKPLRLESVRVGGVARPLADGAVLRHDENDVEFQFALLSYVREEGTVYRTQLVGFDPRPSEWSDRASRNYTNLGRGDYAFLVWGRDAAGNETGPVRLAFSVRAAPWHTWWAYALYALAAVGAVALALRLRTSRLERRGRELERVVAERTTELATTIERLRDSEQQAHDAREEAQQASAAKSVFLANMSHELRTPLNAVIGFAQLMERDARIPEDQRDHLDMIQRSGEHLLGLINDVLSISKVEAGKLALRPAPFRPERLLELAREMIRPRCEAKGLALAFDVEGMPAAVVGDEGKLRQVLLNLLGNAAKFTETGSVTLRARWADGRATVEVEDTGPGIAAEEMDRLFRPFDQTETGRRAAEGSGLGLVISREIVRLMGGDVAVSSEPGRGTTFRFEVELPATGALDEVASRRAVAPVAVALSPGERAPRVLVVDDTAENRLLVVRLLDLVGIEAREAANGREAVELFGSWRPELIFMDIRMPVMDGLEATRRIRELEREVGPVKIVAVTASVFESERAAVLENGADDLVFKPFGRDVLYAKLAEHLGVSFEYEAPAPDASSSGAAAPGDLTAARLAALPAPLRERLAAALELGDNAEALGVVDEIERVDAPLARDLREAVRRYRGEALLLALDAAAPQNPER